MSLNETDTRPKPIDPALNARGWTDNLIRREATTGTFEIVDGKPRKRARSWVDYMLRRAVHAESQPLAVALIEPKAEGLPPDHGVEQAKLNASCKRLNAPLVFSTNGNLFVEDDATTGLTSRPSPPTEFPTPDDLRKRHEQARRFRLDDLAARRLLARCARGEATRRSDQDAAIRAVLGRLARGEKRALLSLATGTGETFIAVQVQKKIGDAGQLKRALFVCDRAHARNGRIHSAADQTLDVDTEDGTANFLAKHYPPDHFSHIILDECHRSAWGKWSHVLTGNPNALQIGLTATPRTSEIAGMSQEVGADQPISADNSGTLASRCANTTSRRAWRTGITPRAKSTDLFPDNKPENEGIERRDPAGKTLSDANTEERRTVAKARKRYTATDSEDKPHLPRHAATTCGELSRRPCNTDGPDQKAIIFAPAPPHRRRGYSSGQSLEPSGSDATTARNLTPLHCTCAANVSNAQYLTAPRDSRRSHLIATTKDPLTTGADAPEKPNIVFGEEFKNRQPPRPPPGSQPQPPEPHEPTIHFEGLDVHLTDTRRFIVTEVGGGTTPVTSEKHKEHPAAGLMAEAPTPEHCCASSVEPSPPVAEPLTRCRPGSRSGAEPEEHESLRSLGPLPTRRAK